jgi:mannitol/fructose-specific phosphotransferase system IIA component (Ntr-type)
MHATMISSRTPEGEPNRCPVCGHELRIDPSRPPGDAPCPDCGSLVWFPGDNRDSAAASLRLAAWAFLDAGIVVLSRPERLPKEEAIKSMLDHLLENGALNRNRHAEAFEKLIRRERVGTTALGRGCALPHCKMEGLDRPVSLLARFPSGVDFDSPDGYPVRCVFLLMSPSDRPGDHLRVLGAMARHLR